GSKFSDNEIPVLRPLEDEAHGELGLSVQRLERPRRTEARAGTALVAATVDVDEALRFDHLFELGHLPVLHPLGPDHGLPPAPARLDRILVGDVPEPLRPPPCVELSRVRHRPPPALTRSL